MSDEEFLKNIGKQIQKARLNLGLSQEDLAQKTQKTQNTISHYENGSRAMNIVQLPLFAEALNVPISYFFGESTKAEEVSALAKDLFPIFRQETISLMARYARTQEKLLKLVNVTADEGDRISISLILPKQVEEILSVEEKQLLETLGWLESAIVLSLRIAEQLLLMRGEGVKLKAMFPEKPSRTKLID